MFWLLIFGAFCQGVSSTDSSTSSNMQEEDSTICAKDMNQLLSYMTPFDHPDLKEPTTSALNSCLKSDFYPDHCITGQNAEFEITCQALGGQFITQQMHVRCDTLDKNTIISNAPNCVPKSCNLNKVKKDLSLTYATSFEKYLNHLYAPGGKCHVSPDFCETDTFDLLGTLNVFQHTHLKEGLAHAFNSCEFDTSYGMFKNDCLMDTTFFEKACETMGGQMVTHHLELACKNSNYGTKTLQIVNSPNCIAKSCDVLRRNDWNLLTKSYEISLEALTLTWTTDGFLRSSVNYHERYPTSDSSNYNSNQWVPRNPGTCKVSTKTTNYPKLLLPPSTSNSTRRKHGSKSNLSRKLFISSSIIFAGIIAFYSVSYFILPRLRHSTERISFHNIIARPMSSTTTASNISQPGVMESVEESQSVMNEQQDEERSRIV